MLTAKHQEIKNLLQHHLNILYKEATANRSVYQFGKASGLGGLILGGIGCFGFPPLGIIAAASGFGLWVTSVFAEGATTGNPAPLPWVSTSISSIAAGLDRANVNAVEQDELELSDYLSVEDRVMYLLILTQGDRLVDMLYRVDESMWAPTLAAVVQQSIKLFGRTGFKLEEGLIEGPEFLDHVEQTFSLPPSQHLPAAQPQAQFPTERAPVQIKTQFGEQSALPVAHKEVPEDPWAAQPIQQFVNSTPTPRNVESAIQRSQVDLFVDGDINPDILAMSLSDRANFLLDCLAQTGCDIRSLIGRPTLASGGLQRSGKTTLILLTAIFEKALGNKIFYISRDNDLYPIAFDGYAIGSIANALQALGNLSQTINNTAMGGMRGQTWVLDEFSSVSAELTKDQQRQFWGMALTGFAKQGGRVRFMVHHKTAGANGLPPGQAETFKSEVKMLWTDRVDAIDGTYLPSGKYELLGEVGGYYRETGETFEIPDWLKFDLNPSWHNAPCPVRSLLRFFPEFDTRAGATAINMLQTKTSFKSGKMPKPMGNKAISAPREDDWIAEEIAPKKEYTTQQKIMAIAARVSEEGSISVNQISRSFKIDRTQAHQLLQMTAMRDRSLKYNHSRQLLEKK